MISNDNNLVHNLVKGNVSGWFLELQYKAIYGLITNAYNIN